ncbi:hypothetical protein [Shewanella inventionis]|uniref:Restriction endonuclease subunit S n=1 Tax=Shewanella inventionis TaxID=1738770 RepID=A0ABQ1JTX2_9GAMM|nr:hypothetical protein [Shewanella inventionis]MCL1160040.1 hypothetical protein [Shewanella inventionis]GGB76854.1 hypothetical protein GCM10011607_41360 [Shewanella inventionis]
MMGAIYCLNLTGGAEQTEIARIIPDTRPSVLLSAVQNRSRRFCVRRVEELFAFADKVQTMSLWFVLRTSLQLSKFDPIKFVEVQVKEAQTRVNNLTQSILAKAFRGELTADWRAANPELISGENSAEALLEKIKVERQSMQGTKTRKKA